MIHFLRFSIALFVLCFSNLTFALEAYVSYKQMTGCGSRGEWVDPNQVNACFMKHDYIRSCTFEKVTYANARYPYQTVCDNSLALSYSEVRCPTNSEFDPSTLKCKSQCEYGANPDGTCMDACQFKQSIGDTVKLHWHPAVYGELVTGACYGDYGATRCEMTKNESIIICTGVPDGQYTPDSQCSLNFAYTGRQCDGGTLFWGANGPDEPIIPPEEPEDPTHEPDDPTGEIEDPSVLPDDSTNTVDPGGVDDEPEVEEPETDESTDTAVVSAIRGLNEDINKGIHDLNVDINESQAHIANAVIDVKGSLVDNTQAIQEQQINDNKIYENTKSLIQQANGDITTAVNNNTNATIGVRNDLQGLGDSLGDLGSSLDSIEGLLTGSDFGTPTGTPITGDIFTAEDFSLLQTLIDGKGDTIQGYVDDIKSLVSIGTDFNNGTLSDKSFSVKGTTVESGLQRFDSVSGYVRPVVLFICTLIALWVLFGNRSK
ncbi:hypothetical protein [Vibrio jasicida]|uniref:hypothetical protein n=1 Tax=Vibrio jasicida TaxID=766224 RepID=UPI001D1179B6|nr:hypothetical protein [Vibrio jasicida]